jgi:hypothetical protein
MVRKAAWRNSINNLCFQASENRGLNPPAIFSSGFEFGSARARNSSLISVSSLRCSQSLI